MIEIEYKQFVFLFLHNVNSIARQLSSALYSSVCMYGISKVGKEFIIINVNRCSNFLILASSPINLIKIMRQIK